MRGASYSINNSGLTLIHVEDEFRLGWTWSGCDFLWLLVEARRASGSGEGLSRSSVTEDFISPVICHLWSAGRPPVGSSTYNIV